MVALNIRLSPSGFIEHLFRYYGKPHHQVKRKELFATSGVGKANRTTGEGTSE
jgi:hypothetical protein